MLRPSGQRLTPPTDMACVGGRFMSVLEIIPLTRGTSRSPATPVPYSFHDRQRAKIFGSSGRFGTRPCHVSQSRFCSERSGGGGYSHAPVGSFRPSQPSTNIRLPIAPWEIISLAFAQ